MSIDGDEDTYLRELNHGLSDDDARVKDGVVKEETNLIEGVGEDVKEGNGGALQAPAASQIQQQQQSQEATVYWERFLHLRSLRVLLVENDDCTRQIVTALLRNCGYEVTEAANGFQAWKILEDLTHHVDLILTEVVMPYLSGVALLCKIMHHKTRRNVPVIMMSSHDSMGLVFKCLSKGAIDFLVKPIRKNELKNLWQHVWRRCQSSSGSGSESGTQNQKSVNSKGVENSDTNNSSNHKDDNGSMGLNVGEGSDDGSGTQSSWTKQAVEVDSPQLVPSGDQVAECPDSTCAQVIHSNAEISSNKQGPVTISTECQEHKEQLGGARTLDLQLGFRAADLVGKNQNNLLEKGRRILNEKIEVKVDPSSDNPFPKLRYEAVDLQGGTTNSTDYSMDITAMEAISRHSKILDVKDKAISEAKEMTSVEVSLKRLRGVKDNVFKRSDSSAFSRYNTASNAKKVPARDVRSGSPHDNGVDVTGKASTCDLQCYSNFSHPNHCSIVGSNNIDVGSTTNISSSQAASLNNMSAAPCLSKCLHPPATFLAKGDLFSASQQVSSVEAGGVACRTTVAQPSGTHMEPQDQHLSHPHDHHHFLLNMQHEHQSHQLPPQLDDLSLKKVAAAAPLCGSSNAFGGAIEDNTGNYSINGSASGSNHGSNGQYGSSTAVNAGVTNVASDNRVAGNSGSGDASGNGGGNRVDHDKIAQRAAALTKFRQKRNERCFRRRVKLNDYCCNCKIGCGVRYESRKKLAEQRPRVRGQFIRHPPSENTSRANDE